MKQYAATIYIEFDIGSEHFSRLLVSKSRVAPRKEHTIPQLELLSALLAARLLKTIQAELSFISNYKCFSDAQIVLAWIKNDSKIYKRFVQDRVLEIRELTFKDNWSYIESNFNPADIATRPQLVKAWLKWDLWWNGPSILERKKSTDKDTLQNVVEEEKEEKGVKVNLAVIKTSLITWNRFSSLKRLLSTIYYV